MAVTVFQSLKCIASRSSFRVSVEKSAVIGLAFVRLDNIVLWLLYFLFCISPWTYLLGIINACSICIVISLSTFGFCFAIVLLNMLFISYLFSLSMLMIHALGLVMAPCDSCVSSLYFIISLMSGHTLVFRLVFISHSPTDPLHFHWDFYLVEWRCHFLNFFYFFHSSMCWLASSFIIILTPLFHSGAYLCCLWLYSGGLVVSSFSFL